MLAKRIIVCLDIKEGRVVKGTNFVDIKDAGDPVELARMYDGSGADELVFLDITATHEGRATVLEMVSKTAEQVSIPFTVGGGIRTIEDMEAILQAGADKVSICTPAIEDPTLITEGAKRFGSQCIIVAIDAKKKEGGGWEAYTHGGRTPSGLDVIEWAQEAALRGAGEILLTSMDADGTKSGYDLDLTRSVSRAVDVPVIASGGVGNLEHLYLGLTEGEASGVLAASIFHYGSYRVEEAKQYLAERGVCVNL